MQIDEFSSRYMPWYMSWMATVQFTVIQIIFQSVWITHLCMNRFV